MEELLPIPEGFTSSGLITVRDEVLCTGPQPHRMADRKREPLSGKFFVKFRVKQFNSITITILS